MVALVQESLKATNDLLDALLDVSQLDAGVLRPRLRDVAIADLTERLEAEFSSQAAAKGLSFRTVVSSAIVHSDPALLDRILRNLLSNAVRYTDRGRVLLGCRRRGPSLRIEVWDTGLGIPEDKRQVIFEEFYQLGNPQRDRTRGLGLGLAIVDRIAKLLGYTLQVHSTPGKGSKFAVEVPLAGQDAEHLSLRPPDDLAARAGALAGVIVVAIDDEPLQLRAMLQLFSRWGCEVVPAASTAEALTRLVELKRVPDAIIADYRLRDEMNGVQAIMTLRAGLGRTIPGIILTGDTEPARLREAQASGFELLHKPVDTDQLFAVLSRMTVRETESPSPCWSE